MTVKYHYTAGLKHFLSFCITYVETKETSEGCSALSITLHLLDTVTDQYLYRV